MTKLFKVLICISFVTPIVGFSAVAAMDPVKSMKKQSELQMRTSELSKKNSPYWREYVACNTQTPCRAPKTAP